MNRFFLQEEAQQHSGASSVRSSTRTTPTPASSVSAAEGSPNPQAVSSLGTGTNPLLFPMGSTPGGVGGAAGALQPNLLPTFSANRSSSSILKSVLHEGAGGGQRDGAHGT